MKKNGILTAAVLLLSMLLSGCNSETDSELEELIGSLPAAQISDGKINFDPPASEGENGTAYSSVTGNVVSVSSKEITVKYNDKEYKFSISGDTKIYGGEIQALKAVTITYEGELSEDKIIAGIITILAEDNSENTELVTAEEPPDTADTEAVTESIESSASEATALETTATAAEASTEASTEALTVQPEETSSAETEETSAADETTVSTEAESETEALPPSETTTI